MFNWLSPGNSKGPSCTCNKKYYRIGSLNPLIHLKREWPYLVTYTSFDLTQTETIIADADKSRMTFSSLDLFSIGDLEQGGEEKKSYLKKNNFFKNWKSVQLEEPTFSSNLVLAKKQLLISSILSPKHIKIRQYLG